MTFTALSSPKAGRRAAGLGAGGFCSGHTKPLEGTWEYFLTGNETSLGVKKFPRSHRIFFFVFFLFVILG